MDCNRTIDPILRCSCEREPCEADPADTCADCGAAIHGGDNASAFGDNLNVCDDCESKREATAERQGCAHCGSTLGLDCGDAEPDYDAMHCSEGCYKAAHSEVL